MAKKKSTSKKSAKAKPIVNKNSAEPAKPIVNKESRKRNEPAATKPSAPALSPLAAIVKKLTAFVALFKNEVTADLKQRFHMFEELTVPQIVNHITNIARNYGDEAEQVKFIADFIKTVLWNTVTQFTQNYPEESNAVISAKLKPILAANPDVKKKSDQLKGVNQTQRHNALGIIAEHEGNEEATQHEFISEVKKLLPKK